MAQYSNNNASKKNRTGWLVGCGVTAVIILCGIGVLVFAIFAGIWPFSDSEPEQLAVTISQTAATVNVGDFFEIWIELSNDGTRNISIEEIQLPNELLANAIVTEVDQGGVLGINDGTRTAYEFDFVIAPNGREQVTFQLQAISDADITGEIRVPVGTSTNLSRFRLLISPMEVVVIPEEIDLESQDDSLPPMGDVIPYQSVVQIIALVDTGNQLVDAWSGSGTIISEDGLILTNEHVVMDARVVVADLLVAVTVQQDQPPVPMFYADVLQADYYLDLAVIKIRSDLQGNPVDLQALDLEPVPIGSSDQLQLGDPMVIIGYPGIGGQTITLTRGEVSGFTAEEPYGNRAFIKTSATIAGGNSGGLAATLQGELVGVPTQLGSGDMDAGFVDCRFLVDTNRDGVIDENDHCIPVGGFINAIRPVALAEPLIAAAKAGEVAFVGPYVHEYPEVDMQGELLFEEFFENNSNNWSLGSSEDGSVDIFGGQLVIDVNRDYYVFWSTKEGVYDSVIIETEVSLNRPAGDGEFGLVCGEQEDGDLIAFQISEDGFFSVQEIRNDEWVTLVEWTYSGFVEESTSYVLAAYCGSDRLEFALNGVLLAEIHQDFQYQPGNVGVMASCYHNVGLTVGFDAFSIMRP